MKKKILVCDDRPDRPFERFDASWHPTHVLSNYFAILNQEYELFRVGFNHPELVTVPLSEFSVTIFWINAPRTDWQPRPHIFIPDSFDVYHLQDLAKMDGIIAYCDEIAQDAAIAGVRCLKNVLPIHLDFFKTIQVERVNKNTAWTNKSVDDIRNALRLCHRTRLQLHSYTNLSDREESRQEAIFGGVSFSERTDWYTFAEKVANSFIALNTYRYRIALGAIAPIAAYAKRVSIGFPHAFQKYLYPNLTSYDPEQLRLLLEQLINDEDFYKENAEEAYSKLYSLEAKNFEEPILNFMEEIIS